MPYPAPKILILGGTADTYNHISSLLHNACPAAPQPRWSPGSEEMAQYTPFASYDLFILVYPSDQPDDPTELKNLFHHVDNIPILLLTASLNPAMAKQAARIGAAETLPLDQLTPLLLHKAIQYILQQNNRSEEPLSQPSKEHTQQSTEELEYLNRQLQDSVEKANLMTRQALQASQAKSHFLANVTHEIRTPLNGILGFAELLTNETLTQTQQDYAHAVLNCGKNLLQFVNDLLDLSKIEAGKMSIEITNCCIEQLLGDIDHLISPMAKQKNIEFNIQLQGLIPEFIRTDPVRLKQCLINLSNNAVKFTEQGHVTLSLAWLCKEGNNYLAFEISDTGIGIPADRQELIFGAFIQAEAGTTRKYGGTGLGLAITRHLVELLKGEITLKSQPGKGSIFTLIIPTGQLKEKIQFIGHQPFNHILNGDSQFHNQLDATKYGDKQYPEMTGKVLVAEDNFYNRKLIETFLRRVNLEVLFAKNGQEAIDTLENNPDIKLILMDMIMPVLDGYQAVTIIRRKYPDLPVIALTANTSPEDKNKCIKAGCNNVLKKPIIWDNLLKTLREDLPSAAGRTLTENKTQHQTHNQKELKSSMKQIDPTSPNRIISNLAHDPELAAVVEMFIRNIPAIMDQIQNAIDNADLHQLLHLAHDLKGTGGNAGFDILYQKARQLEKAAHEKNMQSIQELADQIRQLVPRLTANPLPSK